MSSRFVKTHQDWLTLPRLVSYFENFLETSYYFLRFIEIRFKLVKIILILSPIMLAVPELPMSKLIKIV